MAIGTKNKLRKAGVLSALVPSLLGAQSEARTGEVFGPAIRYGVAGAGYEYMSGGLLLDQQQLMERKSGAYNLKLVVVRPRTKLFVPLQILLANNATGKVENISLSGPWNYFRLPAGSYTIGARIGNRFFLLRDIVIQGNGRRILILKDSQFR
jgi:hypothetical protein